MKVQCVISYGPIQMIDVGGEFLHEELDTLLDKISLNSSTTLMGLVWFLELTSLSWKDTVGPRFVDFKTNGITFEE